MHGAGQPRRRAHPGMSDPGLRDPVCGMAVELSSPHRYVHEGRTFYFCSAGCARRFAEDPAGHLEGSARAIAAEPPVPGGGMY